MTELYDARSDTQKLIDDIKALRAELALVRRDWQADVGTLTARAQTAEARAERSERMIDELSEHINDLEARADPYPQEELIKRDVARAAAARKVAQAYRELWARAEQYENGRWHSFETVQAIVKEREELRAEAARLRELIKDAADGAGYAVTFGNMLVKGETIDNCGDPDAVSYLLGEAKAIEDKLRAAPRENNDGN